MAQGDCVLCSILVANNGIGAVKFIRSVRSWAYKTFGSERAVSLVAMATPEVRCYEHCLSCSVWGRTTAAWQACRPTQLRDASVCYPEATYSGPGAFVNTHARRI